MTDKVQKIKDWISKEQDGLMDTQGNFENPSDEGAFHILTNLDYYIDSLQEEPKPLFNVGDIIRNKQWKTATHKIVSMDDKAYYLENGGKVEIAHQELWEVVGEHANNDLQEVSCNNCPGFNDKEKCDKLVFGHKCPIVKKPVSVWHDSNKEQPNFASSVAIWNPKYKNGEIISRCTEVYSDRIWAYIDDLLKM